MSELSTSHIDRIAQLESDLATARAEVERLTRERDRAAELADQTSCHRELDSALSALETERGTIATLRRDLDTVESEANQAMDSIADAIGFDTSKYDTAGLIEAVRRVVAERDAATKRADEEKFRADGWQKQAIEAEELLDKAQQQRDEAEAAAGAMRGRMNIIMSAAREVRGRSLFRDLEADDFDALMDALTPPAPSDDNGGGK